MMFETAVEAKTQVPKERLAMLIKFTSGEPKHLLETCLYQKPTFEGKVYGNPTRVAKRPDGDGIEIREFFVFLVKCKVV